MLAGLAIGLSAASCGGNAFAQGAGPELPRASEIPGVTADILLRTQAPGAPGEALIVSRTTYRPGARVAWHRHLSQIVFYILQGSMAVQEKDKAPLTLKAGDTLLVKPGTVHRHWNESTSRPLIFLEYILVEKGRRSIVFLK